MENAPLGPLSLSVLHEAMARRLYRRAVISGEMRLPAVPAMIDDYVTMCDTVFAGVGVRFTPDELAHLKDVLAGEVATAFNASARSEVVIAYDSPVGTTLNYHVKPQWWSIEGAYANWVANREPPLFGTEPDARVRVLAEAGAPGDCRVLDIGAGTGRNALALARRGHPVDAVEMTPKFADAIRAEAQRESLDVRVIENDVFASAAELRWDYQLIVVSEVVSDFRTTQQLRDLLELAAQRLAPGGRLVFNIFLPRPGYQPDDAARQLGQQTYTAIFTWEDMNSAAAGLPLQLVSDESVHDYEKSNLPDGAWPQTSWYANWVDGLDVFDIEPAASPIEMRWLVFQKPGWVAAPAASYPPVDNRQPGAEAPRALREALVRRLHRRTVAAGEIKIPAVPGMLDEYVKMCITVFAGLGVHFNNDERAHLRMVLHGQLAEAFAASPRSDIVIRYDFPVGMVVNYHVKAEWKSIEGAYEGWVATREPPLFGTQPDARVWALASESADPRGFRVLDIGAGTGRNSLALARRGHPVDAVEMTPVFAADIRTKAHQEALDVRVIERDVFAAGTELRWDYQLIVLSEVTPDFRTTQQLRDMFELAAQRLAPGGRLVYNVFLPRFGYVPDEAARQLSQQCYNMLFSWEEVNRAAAGLPLQLVSDESVYDYEKANLPEGAWPQTSWYANWVSGLDVFDVAPEVCPVTMRWLVYQKA